jgi:cyclic beta-1,2-glucan synthetase
VRITLPDPQATLELWTISLENRGTSPVALRVVPYLEWVLNKPEADRSHTQYNRLFAEMEYRPTAHMILAYDKHSRANGLLASELAPTGFLTARVDFLGRAGRLQSGTVPADSAFFPAEETDSHPTFDPIAAMSIPLTLDAGASQTFRILLGMTSSRHDALRIVQQWLGRDIPGIPTTPRRKEHHPIRHGAIPPTALPYHVEEESESEVMLHVRTPWTPRPYDHALSNALGQSTLVTNRGLHSTTSVNSQQNRLTPDWADTVTRELPGEAFYIYEPQAEQWYSPTYHPLNDASANCSARFSANGKAIFESSRSGLNCTLTVFVPPAEPATVYQLRIENRSNQNRTLHVSPYFQLVLAAQPEHSGPLAVWPSRDSRTLFFSNPRNTYRSGPAFVSVSHMPQKVVTDRGAFFGVANSVAHPEFLRVATAEVADTSIRDGRPVAGFRLIVTIPANSTWELTTLLGQADSQTLAEQAIARLLAPSGATQALADTQQWWEQRHSGIVLKTADRQLDRYLVWLRYQALAERIWARRGFYQSSGAFGFRDQLQDSVNLIWMDPAIARRQICLHAAQQFLEGDVVHWFHQLQDGRTGLVGRTHASDNLLWLVWAVVDYLSATGDTTLLDECVSYLESDLPFVPLPEGKHGMGFEPLRSSRSESIYRHCLKSLDLVLEQRMGKHGLPLMGTGDWNDGLDEIGSQGRGESVWLGFFLHYSLSRMIPTIAQRDGSEIASKYQQRLTQLESALQATWRGDRYLRAIHDDGTEIGVAGSGIWEIDALTASWAVMSGIDPARGRTIFDTAIQTLEKETTILLGWPPLREETKPYLGRSSAYPEGVRENGMYCHGVQWLVGAARLLAEQLQANGDQTAAQNYAETAERLWRKISPLDHTHGEEAETYGGQPNKQSADMVTTFEPGRMIWHGYTGAAGWMFRQAIEGVLGLKLEQGVIRYPTVPASTALQIQKLYRQESSKP